MFSGSRCCLRIKVNHRLLPGDSQLNQPLLFLCPSWFSLHQRRNSTKPSTHELSEGTERSFTYTTSESRKVVNPIVSRPLRYHNVPQQPSQNPTEAPANTYQENRLRFETASEQGLDAICKRRKERQGVVTRARRPDGIHHIAYFSAPGSTSYTEHRVKKDREGRFAFSSRSTWERTLNMLANSVPRSKEDDGEEIWVSKQTLLELCGESGPNSWVHHARGGCEVQVTENQSPGRTSRLVFLRGSTRAVALTREYFALLETSLTQHRHKQLGSGKMLVPSTPEAKMEPRDCEGTSEGSTSPPIRVVSTAGKGSFKQEKWIRADALPPPLAYDVRSFNEYVEDLTTARAPRTVRREVYGSQGDRHDSVVADILCRLFTDTSTARFASTVALNRAFGFLCRHTELFHQTNLLYDQCRQLRLTLQPRTYSYVLRAMLLIDEMAVFRRVLDDLLSEGHKPDSGIWLALLESGNSLQQKRAIADWIYRKGLLGNSLVRGKVAAAIVRAELKVKMHDGKDAGLFIESIDARFGRDWMSQSSVTAALLACSDNKAWTLANEVLEAARGRDVDFDLRAISAILTVMQRQGSLRDSLDFLRSHFVRTSGRNDVTLVPIIFMTAWKRRSYNVCRALWRYAAVKGAITYRMQNLVIESLLRNQDIPSLPPGKAGLTVASQEWRRRAGKIIVGTDIDTKDMRQTFNLLAELPGSTSANPMTWLSQYTLGDEVRDQQLSLAYVMIHRDLVAWRYFAPPSSERLFNILTEAYAMDIQWKSEGIGLDRGGKSTPWMVDNAIDVPLVRRQISVQHSGPRYQPEKSEGENIQVPRSGKDRDVAHDDD